MTRSRRTVATASVALAAVATLGATHASAAPSPRPRAGHPGSRHVLLLSVDGLHQSDLDRYVLVHPGSALARLVRTGTSYTHASTPVPSDSFPGMVGQVTGGNPRTTGIYYDDTWNRGLLPAGTTHCAGASPGAEVAFTEAADKDQSRLDAGQGLSHLPSDILQMTGHPQSLLNPAALPVDPRTCRPVMPHQALKVNTVFEVAKRAGLHTAWSDKHPAYEILGGPSGTGLDDLFAPEINSDAPGYATGDDWTKDNAATRQYDGFKVRAVLNEINGLDHSGRTHAGVPAIFGMNFQSVSTAQKLPTSGGQPGGYLADGTTPGPVLSQALDFVDSSVGAFEQELAARHLTGSTTVILSAKHGQSPTRPADLTRVPDAPILKGINDAWSTAHPGAGDLVAFSTDDDIVQLWLRDRSAAATDFVRAYLLGHPATGNDIHGASRTVPASGLTSVYAGTDAARFFGVGVDEARHPDVVGIARHGVVFTGGTSKIAEHGGADPQDRDVPLVVSGPAGHPGSRVPAPVETTQVAPTILRLLGLDPRLLQAVRIEGTRSLPGLLPQQG
ncbi:alkaline phosphatase family protein [Oryzihumus leptocrescens]|uniref:Type I phosphodiesterase/nucleotide pyrophosphatase n=1 Tax=Oryzihumus leptocrescens TaxID=297536 RepID=A0A542Z8S0_9MICO|nr:alkaline phosphatase family protein [Oryzihumus leptocrescens]TQL56711.1 type I phosphodiesterase/nucleotide pyrophosphatase [Oryzihumus leptocrescens]